MCAASGSSASRRSSTTTASRAGASYRSASGTPGWRRSQLPVAARRQIQIALAMIDAVDTQLGPLDRELRALARRQPGCRALQAHYGIGEITAVVILAELGAARRFRCLSQAVRYAGMDITFSQSDRAAQLGRRPTRPTATTTSRPPTGSAATAPTCCSAASHAARARRGGTPAGLAIRCAPKPDIN